jgi:hypothetical protein
VTILNERVGRDDLLLHKPLKPNSEISVVQLQIWKSIIGERGKKDSGLVSRDDKDGKGKSQKPFVKKML